MSDREHGADLRFAQDEGSGSGRRRHDGSSPPPKAPGVAEAFQAIRSGRPVRVYRGSRAIRVCESADIPRGAPREEAGTAGTALAEEPPIFTIVDVEGHSIGIARVNGTLHAVRNECPHNGAPLCRGTVSGTYQPGPPLAFEPSRLEGRIVACPWHGRQFDIVTGQALHDPAVSVLTYEVWEQDGGVFVRV